MLLSSLFRMVHYFRLFIKLLYAALLCMCKVVDRILFVNCEKEATCM